MDLKQMKLLLRDSYHSKHLINCLVQEVFSLRNEVHRLEDTVLDMNNRLRLLQFWDDKAERP